MSLTDGRPQSTGSESADSTSPGRANSGGNTTGAMSAHRAERARPTERLNRVLLTIVGLLLVAAGIYTLLRSWGALGDAAAAEPLFTANARDWVQRNEEWFWPVMAGVSTLVALLALRWLLAQLRTTAKVEIYLP